MDLEQQKNSGFIEEPQKVLDWEMGGESGIGGVVNSLADWAQDLPDGERQSNANFDTYGCVSFSANNCLEIQLNYQIRNGLIKPEALAFLQNNGYLVNGKVNFSDRFLAKVSGTTQQGNSMTKVWDSIRKYGAVPESAWAFPSNSNWTTYYGDVPAALFQLGLEFLKHFQVQYEWVVYKGIGLVFVDTLKAALLISPCQIASPTCSPWNTDALITNCGLTQPNHCTTVFKVEDGDILDFDQYSPFVKHLSKDYPIIYVMRGVISSVTDANQAPVNFAHNFDTDMNFGDRSDEVTKLQLALQADGEFPVSMQATGYYGAITQAAVKAFQIKHAVAPLTELAALNGKKVGPQTRASLNLLFNK